MNGSSSPHALYSFRLRFQFCNIIYFNAKYAKQRVLILLSRRIIQSIFRIFIDGTPLCNSYNKVMIKTVSVYTSFILISYSFSQYNYIFRSNLDHLQLEVKILLTCVRLMIY